jgi:flagellar FliL protein
MAAEIPVLAPADASAVESKPKGKSKLLLIIVAAVVVLGGGGAAALWFKGSTHKAEAAKPAVVVPPVYLALDPPFVVNFESEQAVRFLQVSVQLMSRDPATIELLKANDPVLRNDLLLLLGNQKYSVVSTREGKEALRNEALADARKVLSTAGGTPEKLEAVYFTSFVMQ